MICTKGLCYFVAPWRSCRCFSATALASPSVCIIPNASACRSTLQQRILKPWSIRCLIISGPNARPRRGMLVCSDTRFAFSKAATNSGSSPVIPGDKPISRRRSPASFQCQNHLIKRHYSESTSDHKRRNFFQLHDFLEVLDPDAGLDLRNDGNVLVSETKDIVALRCDISDPRYLGTGQLTSARISWTTYKCEGRE